LKSSKLKLKKAVPFEFVLEALATAHPTTRPMFGCTSIYLDEKIVLILREKEAQTEDNGVWLATTREHHASLARDFPSMRSIAIFGAGPSSWQILPADSDDFEEAALKACKLVLRGDPRIGKIPAKSKKKTPRSGSKRR
jgi:hypothetical protein